jgi:transcription initiation factor TFIIB
MIHTVRTTDDERTDNRQSPSESISTVSCPECTGQIIQDDEHGEKRCEDCGLVLDEDAIDHGPEWRAFNTADVYEKRRVGAPTTQLMHDKGLSTTIGWQNKDAYGKVVPEQKRAKLQRLRRWDERFRTKGAHDRNLKQAFNEIQRMASALGLADPVRETAAVLYRRALEEDLLPGRSIEGMATAALYAAARSHDTPRTLAEFATVSRVEQLRIQRAYWYLSRELGLQIEPADPLQYISQFASALNIREETVRQAQELLTTAKAQNAHSGRKPAGLAAGAIYAATCLTDDQVTQMMVSEVTHISRMTIRVRYQELLDMYTTEENNA